MTKTKSACLSLVCLALGGCVPRSFHADVDHTLGEMGRHEYRRLAPCVDGKDFPQAIAYLRRLAQRIAAHNPSTFSGNYDISKFCFKVEESRKFNANANNERGTITMSTEVFRTVANDAQAAAVLAHELTHVTLDHRQTALHPLVRDRMSPAELAVLDRYIEAVKRNADAYFALQEAREARDAATTPEERDRLDAVMKEADKKWGEAYLAGSEISTEYTAIQERIEREVFGENVDFQKLRSYEIEADEAGFELYLRAGFSPEFYISNYQRNLGLFERMGACGKAEDFQRDLTMSEPRLDPGNGGPHPSPCWRIFNIRINEFDNQHKEVYRELMKTATAATVFPGELERLKQLF